MKLVAICVHCGKEGFDCKLFRGMPYCPKHYDEHVKKEAESKMQQIKIIRERVNSTSEVWDDAKKTDISEDDFFEWFNRNWKK